MLEALVAASILALALLALLRSQSSWATQAATLQQAYEATETARSVLDEFGLSRPIREGAQDGDVGAYWWWRAEISVSASVDPVDPQLREATISVSVRRAPDGAPIATLRTIRLYRSGR